MKIYLSPSDQWGNKTASGHSEAHHCTEIAKACYKYLKKVGYDVKIGNNTKQGTYATRVKESNLWGADLHIPIHTNAGGGDGTVVFVYDKASANNKYVKKIYNGVAYITPGVDDGIKINPSLYEINATKAMCCYIEVEFHDNSWLEKWIDENVDTIGYAIALSIARADGCDISRSPSISNVNNPDAKYKVQVGAFVEKSNAEAYANDLKVKGFDAFVVG